MQEYFLSSTSSQSDMQSDTLKHDVIILGGGPSGLSTALHLQQIAPHLTDRILILEKEHYPRLKLCAGGLVGDAEVILKRLGLDVTEIPHVDAVAAHFDFAGRGLTVRVRKNHIIRVIRRDEFDHWLAKKAESRGIEIRQGVTVKKVVPAPEGVTIETDSETYRAKIVVGADGSNGVARKCVLPDAPVYTARVLEVLTPLNQAIAREVTHLPTKREALAYDTFRGRREERPARNDIRGLAEAYFDFFPVPENIAGYVWDFPTQVNGKPMRCWGVYDTNILAGGKRPQLKESLAQEMSRFGFDLNDYELKGHPIRWFSPENKMSVPRVLLVGDAAGADPIFGEGISMALGFGAIAAREMSESFQRNDFSFNGYKFRVMRSGLGQTLLARWLFAYIIYPFKWRWFQILTWRIMKPLVLLVARTLVLNWAKRI